MEKLFPDSLDMKFERPASLPTILLHCSIQCFLVIAQHEMSVDTHNLGSKFSFSELESRNCSLIRLIGCCSNGIIALLEELEKAIFGFCRSVSFVIV